MPGIFVQTIAFASATTAIGIADDMGKGLIDRFRSLPMARSAVLTGRTIADVIYQAGILVVLMLAGLVVGWRVNNGFAKFIFAVVLLLAFAYVMAWIGVWIGLSVPNTETAQQLTFVTIFPLTFISNVFVPSVIARNLAADSRVEPRQYVDGIVSGALRQSKPDDWYGVPQPAPD